ncbi:MAG: putative short-chain dehydrogenase/reductase [Acidimicrobiaceae bacterium]|nr:putative short-chain dehydrogenase/reductase [Acidimicrobiaceae bacterium]
MTDSGSERRLDGQVVVITGASDGIGAAAAERLGDLGARLALVGRSPEKTEAVAARTGGTPYVCDFASLSQVRHLADRLCSDYERIDVLANNAGLLSRSKVVTEDGNELTFQVNHLAPFLLTNLVADRLGPGSRVIQTSSRAQMIGRLRPNQPVPRRYQAFRVYGTTKLENVIFSRELDRRWRSRGISAAAFHPGAVRTEFGRRGGLMAGLVYRTPLRHVLLTSPERGADTLVWLVSSVPGVDWRSGGYYANCRPAPINPLAERDVLADWLWTYSSELTGLA